MAIYNSISIFLELVKKIKSAEIKCSMQNWTPQSSFRAVSSKFNIQDQVDVPTIYLYYVSTKFVDASREATVGF